MKSIFAICLFIALAQTEVSGPSASKPPIPDRLHPVIETGVDRAEIQIGDVVTLTLSVEHDSEIEVYSGGAGFNPGKFEVLNFTPGMAEKTADGKEKRVDVYELSIYESGEFEIPAQELRFQMKDGRAASVATSPIQIKVASVLPDGEDEIEPDTIKPPALPEGESHLWRALLLAALLIAAAALALWLWRRRTHGPKEAPAPPPEPAHVIAYRALEALRQRTDLIEQMQYKPFSIEVSEILRTYMRNRWGITALDETSHEMMSEIQTLRLPQAMIHLFRDFFDACDLMKFAKHEPGSAMFDDLIEKVKRIVDETKQAESAGQDTRQK